MRHLMRSLLSLAAITLVASLPAVGQSGGVQGSSPRFRLGRTPQPVRAPSTHIGGVGRFSSGVVNPPSHQHRHNSFPQFVFVPGFGFRPVIHEAFTPGFDAFHHSILHRRHRNHGLFLKGGFHHGRFFGGGFFNPFFPVVTGTSIVVVPQVVQVPVPVVVPVAVPVAQGSDSFSNVPIMELDGTTGAGLAANWSEHVRVVEPSIPSDQEPLPQLTLLALKDGTIYAATDYWLEDGRIFYVSSTGVQYSMAVRELDWEMTTRLNAERHVKFVLEPAR